MNLPFGKFAPTLHGPWCERTRSARWLRSEGLPAFAPARRVVNVGPSVRLAASRQGQSLQASPRWGAQPGGGRRSGFALLAGQSAAKLVPHVHAVSCCDAWLHACVCDTSASAHGKLNLSRLTYVAPCCIPCMPAEAPVLHLPAATCTACRQLNAPLHYIPACAGGALAGQSFSTLRRPHGWQ